VLRSKSFIDLVNASTFGAKMPRADWGFIGSIPIAFPPTLPEQEGILAEVRERTTRFQDALDAAEREIDLMREYRTRLTADVVTGKIDVRDAAAALPVDFPEEVANDDALTETVDDDVEVISNA
jgi:type I restriction enzyme, S subunit